jgi:hypothetical protein
MWQVTLTGINLTIAAAMLVLGITKGIAARREPGINLILTASVLLHACLIFLLATPFIGRAVGSFVGSPNLPAVAIDIATLLCIGHAQVMTQLWHPVRHTREEMRRSFFAWLPMYTGAITLMAVLYALADAPEPARPLRFAVVYASVPEVFALKIVYFAALIIGVAATIVQCREVALPGRPDLADDLRRCVRWFIVAVGLDLGCVVFTLAAMISAVDGDHSLDAFTEASWVATIASGIAASWGLGRLSLASSRDERRDIRALQPLWELTVHGTRRRMRVLPGWDRSMLLDRLMMEIGDGIGHLRPWISSAPALAVTHLAEQARPTSERHSKEQSPVETPGSIGPFGDQADFVAAQSAATLLYAARLRADGRPPVPPQDRTKLPGIEVPQSEERAHLVRVAHSLTHPTVTEAQTLVATMPVPATPGD